MAKQRVAQFRKVEEEKLLNDTKRIHEEQVNYKNNYYYFIPIENIIRKRPERRIGQVQ